MTIIECIQKELALNLNPYQIFIFESEKLKSGNDWIKKRKMWRDYDIVFIPFDVEKQYQTSLGNDIDPLLYFSITHADIVARVMPRKSGEYRYATEILTSDDLSSREKFAHKLDTFVDVLDKEKSKSFVNTVRRFFQYGNDEFADLVLNAYEGNVTKLIDMSKQYTSIVCSAMMTSAEVFLTDFINNLSEEKQLQLGALVKDSLSYPNEAESIQILEDFLNYNNDDIDSSSISIPSAKTNASRLYKPDFTICVSSAKKDVLSEKDKDGDYEITFRRDSGESFDFVFGHRGDKMLYLLTLLCQKYNGGLPTRYFKDKRSKRILEKAFNKVYRSGGSDWVEKCSSDAHNISMYRSHAKEVIEKDERLKPQEAYYCNFENETIQVGHYKHPRTLELRKIRLSNDRIVINDDALDECSFDQLFKDMPSFSSLFDNKELKEALFEIHKNMVCGADQREDDGKFKLYGKAKHIF